MVAKKCLFAEGKNFPGGDDFPGQGFGWPKKLPSRIVFFLSMECR